MTHSKRAITAMLFLAGIVAWLPASCAEVDSGNCGDAELQAGEECDGLNLNGLDCAALGREAGELTCSLQCELDFSGCGACMNPCPNPGTQRCNADRVEACDYGPTDCLQWQITADCVSASQICDSSAGTPQCAAP